MTSEERELLKRMDAGELDGMVGDMFQTDGGSTVWTIIKNGIPVRFKQGPGGKFFNGKENERYEGVLHTLAKWMTDEERLDFLRKFGWLIHDAAVNAYSCLLYTSYPEKEVRIFSGGTAGPAGAKPLWTEAGGAWSG